MSPRTDLHAATALAALGLLAAAPALLAQERYEVSGPHVAIYDLVGQVTLTAASGSAVRVEVARGGADRSQLKIAQGPIGDRATLRVMYPSDDIRYPAIGFRGNTEERVREDGTFGDSENRDRSWREGRRVRISDHGDFEAYADLTIGVPEGQRIDVYVAVGKLSATNVHGRLRLDGASADVTASGIVGPLVVDVGSGQVQVRDVRGDLDLDTGSGDVDASAIRGDAFRVETGSGSVTLATIQTRLLDVDTGSGDVEVTGAAAEEVKLDTGSGSVRCTLTSDPGRLDVDTGSGEVTLTVPPSYGAAVDIDTGSGGIEVDFPVTARKFGRDHLTGQIGDGHGTLHIETGSGGVHLRRGAA